MRTAMWFILPVMLACLGHALADGEAISPEKKVVVWTNPPAPTAEVVAQVSRWPIDGLIWVPWVGEGKVSWLFFGPQFIPPESWQGLFDGFRQVDFKNQGGHLLCTACGPGDCDWFDDLAWAMILDKARTLAELCRVGKFAGFMLDTEQYGPKTFAYFAQPQADRYTYEEYAQQARKRGRQFMMAITQAKPDIVVMMTIATSYAAEQLEKGLPAADSDVGLLIPFVDGMLEVAGEATIIDGHEGAYGYKTYAQFADARRLIKETAAKFSSNPELFKDKLQVGFGMWLPSGGHLDPVNFDDNYFTPEEFEYALHYALLNSDGFVWIYSDGLDWFRQAVPLAYLDAIRRAREPHDLDWQPPKRAPGPPPEQAVQPPEPYAPRAAETYPADYSDETTFRRLRGKFVEFMDLPKTWKFKLDERDVGEREKWYAPELDDSGWDNIQIGDWWEPQGYVYDGVAWYRLAFEVRGDIPRGKVLLAFGAVDEDAWVYLNGKLVAQHAFGGPGWNTPFEVDIADSLLPGEKNVLVVRVQDKVGVGGIWKSVKLFVPKE